MPVGLSFRYRDSASSGDQAAGEAGNPWAVTSEAPVNPWTPVAQTPIDATPNPEDVAADESTVPGAQPPSAPPQGQPTVPDDPWAPVDEQPMAAFERAAARVKGSVKPEAGRKESMVTKLPEAFVEEQAKGLLDMAAAPGKALQSTAENPVTSESAIAPATSIALATALPGGVVGVPRGGTVLGAGPVRRTTPVTAPPPPAEYVTRGTAEALANDLQTIRQSTVADKAEIGNTIKALPAEAKDPAMGEKLYHAAEDPAEYARLTPAEKALSGQHLDPLRQEQFDLALEAKKLGGSDLVDDPNFMHRIAKGHAPQYDTPGSSYDPVTGTGKLPRTTSALQERKFYAIESPTGVRKVVTPNANGVTVWNNRTGTSVPTNGEIRPGEVIDINGQQWTVKPARTKEIEQHGLFDSPTGPANAEYHKNAFVNTADAVVHLRDVVRNLKFLQEVKSSPWWLQHAQSVRGNAKVPEGWMRPQLPALHDWWVDPKIAAVLDDFYKPGILEPENALRKINQFATSSMFWNPIPHMQNVGVHWAVGRGWDWIRPGPTRHFAQDMTRAIKATVTQNHDYQRFLRQGGGLVYGGVKNADFYGNIGREMGMDIEKNWSQYQPIFKKLGISKPAEAVAWWYGKMRETLWASSDMFMMHRYLELERKGMSSERAMREAEKHIPNYRIPSEVMKSRTLSRVLQEPALTNFARYHYGMWKSFMNMATDVAKGSPAEKKEALGNVAALAFMGYVIYPVMDALYQKATGDPNAKSLRRGAMSVPHALAEVSRDRMSFSQFLQSNITPAPATKEILQQFFGKDFFTGAEMGDVPSRVEHAAGAMVSPYATARQLTSEAEGARGAGRTAIDTIVGGENTSERTEKGKRYGAVVRERARKHRREKPAGPIEKGYNAVEQGLGLAPEPKPKKEKKSHHNKEKGY